MSPFPLQSPIDTSGGRTVPASVEYQLYLDAGEKIPMVITANLLIGFLTTLLLWGHIPARLLTLWLAFFIASLAYRGVLAMNYRRARSETLARWQHYFIAGSFFSGSAWGMAGLLMEFHLTGSHQGFAAFILGGMAAGSLITNSAIRWNFPAFMLPALLTLTGYFLYQADLHHTVMALMLVTFMISFGMFASKVRRLAVEQHMLLAKQRESEQWLKDITSSIGEGVFVVDSEGGLCFINQEGERLLGRRFEELKAARIHELVHAYEYDPDVSSIVQQSFLQNRTIHTENSFFRRKNGEAFPVSLTASPIWTEQGISGTVVVFADITKRKAMEEELARLAQHDPLTSLYNRGSFDQKFEKEIKRAYRYGRSVSLMILDIDFFKKVNDTYGHQAGDKILKGVADIIGSSIRSSDFAARYGGEEFAIVSPETEGQQALNLAERLRLAIEASEFAVSAEKTVRLTVSIGMGSSPGDIPSDQLLEATDQALYQAKTKGRNQVQKVV